MGSRRVFFFLSALFFFLYLAFSGGCIKASAVLSGGRFMTPSETQEVFGSSIPFEYFDGTDYVESSFLYDSTTTVASTDGDLPSNWSDFSGGTYLKYIASAQGLNQNINYITVKIRPTYSIFNTEQITTLLALSSNSQVSNSYQSPSWDWVISGQRYHYENTLTNSNDQYSRIAFSQAANSPATFVPMQFISQFVTSGYSLEANFCGNSVATSSSSGSNRYRLVLFLMCPYVSSSADGATGTFTETSGSSSGDINVSVDVDMDETNSLLDDIKTGLGGIVLGIGNLFIPDESVFSDFWDDLEQAIYDKLDPLYTVCVHIDSVFTNIRDTGAGTHFHIDTVTFPVGDNQTMTLGNWDVPIVPDIPGNNVTDGLMWTCKRIISIVCTIAFINMCKTKIELFFNPDAEKVE